MWVRKPSSVLMQLPGARPELAALSAARRTDGTVVSGTTTGLILE